MKTFAFFLFLNWLALDHVGRFEDICCSSRLPALKDLYFSFRFPQERERAWHTSSFGKSNKWPFDNIGCFTNERLTSDCVRAQYVPKMFIIVYKHPINVLLKHSRSLLNHSIAAHASHSHTVNQSHSIQWICDQMNEPNRIRKTFRTIASGLSRSLSVKFSRKRVSEQLDH